MRNYILALFSLIITFFFLKKSLPYFKKYLLDNPNQRSSHKVAKPRGGGIGFVFVGSIFCLLSGNIIPLYCVPLSVIGIIDDLYNLPAFLRYVAQFITVSLLLFLNENSFLIQNFLFLNSFIFCFFVIILATAIINFSNFMDGIDGLVAGCFVVILLFSSIVNDSSILPLVTSVLGFLILNWNPSKLFMGDSGSTFLGAVLVGLILHSGNIKDSISLILISSPLLFDAATCVIRRLYFGENIFKAHKSHLYQRLVQSGWSHSKVSTLYISVTIFLAISYLIFGLIPLLLFSLLMLIFGIYLDLYIAVPFKLNYKNN